jgi:TrmH family RNA methyltransferase
VAAMIEISSIQNPRIKDAISLYDRRSRDKSGLFLIEGYRELLRANQGGQKILELYFSPPLFLGTNEQDLIDALKINGAKLYLCSEKVFRKLSYRDRPDGLMGIAEQKRGTLDQFSLSSNPLLVVAEAIEKPGNLGTILRSSDACGVDGLIVCDRCTDIYNPNVVRASVGTLFTVPVVETKGEEALVWLKDRGVKLVAATPSATLSFTEADLSGPVAIAVGTEQLGLSQQFMEKSDIQVKIPMLGVADSLNVAMATTLLLYEALRQRSKKR